MGFGEVVGGNAIGARLRGSAIVARPPLEARGVQMNRFEFICDSDLLSRRCGRLLDFTESHQHGLHKALSAYWAARLRPICEGDGVNYTAPTTRETTECYRAGICICSPSGKKVKSFRNSVHDFLKRNTPVKSSERALLEQGFCTYRPGGWVH